MNDPSCRHRFRYPSSEVLLAELAKQSISLPWRDDISCLLEPLDGPEFSVPNRLAVQPMEGYDAASDGNPTELTFRRYGRYAGGGSGLLWFEATAVEADGRSNPHQLYLHDGSVARFASLVESTRYEAQVAFGGDHTPLLVLQLTHSGRWSRPEGKREPKITHHCPDLDGLVGIDDSYRTLEDGELDRIGDVFVKTARYAADAGFDGVDVKACHGYLISELLAGFTRTGSYGGSLENRSRLLMDVVKRIRDEVPSLVVACRLNAYDGLPFPYGFGVDENDARAPDLSEPKILLGELERSAVSLVNVSVGVPYLKPHLGRPFLRSVRGTPPSPENPFKGVERLVKLVGEMQESAPDLPVVGTGYSYLRQFFPQVAAGAMAEGMATLAGVGRMAFAYPQYARDLMELGELDPGKCCMACSGCTELMRAGGPTGCVVRDRDLYRIPRRKK